MNRNAVIRSKYKDLFSAVYRSVTAVLLVLVLVLELAAKHRSGKGTNDSVATHLVSSKVPCGASSQCAHQSSVALSLRVGIGGAIRLLAGLSVRGLRVVWVLVLLIGALLRELLRWS